MSDEHDGISANLWCSTCRAYVRIRGQAAGRGAVRVTPAAMTSHRDTHQETRA